MKKIKAFQIIFILIIFKLQSCHNNCEVNTEINSRFNDLKQEIVENILEQETWGDFKCDLVFLGDTNNEIYVKIMCEDKLKNSGFSTYGLVKLNEKNEIIKVIMPRDGNLYAKDLENNFPECISHLLK